MNYCSEKTDKLINYIPIVSGIVLIFFKATFFNGNDPAEIFLNNAIFAVSYPLLFLYCGYRYGLARKDGSVETTFISQLKHVGIFYGFVVLATMISRFANEGVSAFREALLFLLRGVPEGLWFVPAAVLALVVFRDVERFFKTSTMVKISGVLFIVSLLFTTYGGVQIPLLNTIKYFVGVFFGGSHCGVFSALFFVSLGVRYSEKGVSGKAIKHIFVFVLSLILMLVEIALLSLNADLTNAMFFISTALAAVSAFSIILKVPDMKMGVVSSAGIGSSVIFIGQLLCSVCSGITVSGGFLFGKLFSTTSQRIEVILILTFIAAFAIQAYLGKDRWVDSFVYCIESTIVFVLRPFAYVMTAIGPKIKNVILTISFGTLPVLLWFFERELKRSLCYDIFVFCLIAVILCSLSYPMRVKKKNGAAFALFFLAAIMIYLSAKTFAVGSYNQIGRLMVYFVVPLAAIISNRKDFLPELLKNYTTGMYISFVAFVMYCLMFRPYDITRYRGAFCNANMCGLYLVAIIVVALWNLPDRINKNTFSKNILHWAVFGISFGFLLLTISRTAFVGAVVAVFVKFCAVIVQKQKGNTTILQKTKSVFATALPFVLVIVSGLAVSYISVRLIPGIVDRPSYLIYEITDQLEYKVFPGAGLGDENYISPLRFIQAWLNRSFVGYESVNALSTGRITIYLEYLKNLALNGHPYERIYIEGESLPMLAHNVFLQIAYNCGIIAGVIYLIYCVFCFVYGSRRYLKKDSFSLYSVIAIVAYAACGMFESMEAYYYPLLFSAFIGLLPIVCAREGQDLQDPVESSELIFEQMRAKQRMQKILSIIAVVAVCVVVIYFIFVASSKPNKYILDEMLK